MSPAFRSNRFLRAALVAAIIVAGYNVAIAVLAKSSLRHTFTARLNETPARCDVLFLGNSLVEAGCDASSFERGWREKIGAVATSVNIALGETTPAEHYVILKRALERTKAEYVIYGFFDDQLNSDVRGDWADLIGNRAISYAFPADAAEIYAPGSALKQWQLALGHWVPMLGERTSLWKRVEMIRRHCADIGLAERKRNRFGRVDDFDALVASNLPAFNARCADVLDSRRGFSEPIQKMIRLATENGMTFVLVEMPVPPRHRQTFYASPKWVELRAHLQDTATQMGALYIAAAEWVQDGSDFDDTVHLSEAGARIFSVKLAETLNRLKPTTKPMEVVTAL